MGRFGVSGWHTLLDRIPSCAGKVIVPDPMPKPSGFSQFHNFLFNQFCRHRYPLACLATAKTMNVEYVQHYKI